jgi:SAM-dependent methyltransferase
MRAGVDRRSAGGDGPSAERLNSYRRRLSDAEIERGEHRGLVGGLWDELGRLQFEFMVREAGLRPEMKLLDIGCGCLRGGVHFVAYLDSGNYYGIDANRSLIEAGHRVELPRHGLEGRLDRRRLLVADDFGAWRFGVRFDRAVAISVWTHLPLNHLQRSLHETARVLEPGGALYASFFLCGVEEDLFEPLVHEPGGITTHRDRDPYHYRWDEIREAAAALGLRAELLGDWGHPRAQQMVRVTAPRPSDGTAGAQLGHKPGRSRPVMAKIEPPARPRPRVSVVLIAYEMRRELPRTLRSLSPAMQRGVDAEDYELIVVDNGSTEQPDRAGCERFGAQLRWLRIDDALPSPAAAINRGISIARAPLVGAMIDGARIVSPGVLQHALLAASLHPRPVIATLGFHLGPDLQRRTILRGYDQAAEDALLDGIDWTQDGYRLFDVSVFAGSSKGGWFAPLYETNALFLPAELWAELGGFDERFRSPGGGFVNVDVFNRACELPGARLIVLLGEGTFHQVHGGVATNDPETRRRAFRAEYERLTGRRLQAPNIQPLHVGTVSEPVMGSIAASASGGRHHASPGAAATLPPPGDHARTEGASAKTDERSDDRA